MSIRKIERFDILHKKRNYKLSVASASARTIKRRVNYWKIWELGVPLGVKALGPLTSTLMATLQQLLGFFSRNKSFTIGKKNSKIFRQIWEIFFVQKFKIKTERESNACALEQGCQKSRSRWNIFWKIFTLNNIFFQALTNMLKKVLHILTSFWVLVHLRASQILFFCVFGNFFLFSVLFSAFQWN